MEPKIIGVKELQKNFSRISRAASRGGSFVVMKYTRPMFRIEPMYGPHTPPTKKKYTLEDLLSLRFKSHDPNLSKKVDEIAYGV